MIVRDSYVASNPPLAICASYYMFPLESLQSVFPHLLLRKHRASLLSTDSSVWIELSKDDGPRDKTCEYMSHFWETRGFKHEASQNIMMYWNTSYTVYRVDIEDFIKEAKFSEISVYIISMVKTVW